MRLSDYTYQATKYHWQLSYKGVIVAGYSRNVNQLSVEPGIEWYEYHRDLAKQELLKRIKNVN
jgi:hypothetical protein